MTNKINGIYLIDFIGYFYSRITQSAEKRP